MERVMNDIIYGTGIILIGMIKILFVVCVAAIAVLMINSGEREDQLFQVFKQTYQKTYNRQEEGYRRFIFLQNKAKIDAYNQKQVKSFTMAINQFADLTQAEFQHNYLGLTVHATRSQASIVISEELAYEVEIDWQQDNKTARVKNQGMCLSCWAFSTVAAIESAYMIRGVNQQFSEQQLVDCSNIYGNKGCHGGELQYGYYYVQQKGVNLASTYPYVAKDQNCKKTHGPYKITGFGRAITCSGLYNALLKGPVSVAVDANDWGFYKQGIYDDCGNDVDHGVLVVGWTEQYWRIKNSWGAGWGEKGFMKVRRGNTCAICEYPYFPLI